MHILLERWQATVFVLTGLIPLAEKYVESVVTKRGRRSREMTHKHLELAVFTIMHEGETLAARMAEWNSVYPRWAYRTVEHFGGDSRLAVRRLVEERTNTDGSE